MVNIADLKEGQELYQIHIGRIVKGTVDKIYSSSITLKVKGLCLSEEYTYLQCHNWFSSLEEALQSFIDNTNKNFDTDFKLETVA